MPPGKPGGDYNRRPAGEDVVPTNTLWVANLSSEADTAEVMAAFANRGALDCLTMRSGSRPYAFVLFRNPGEARAAMDAIQGVKIRGIAIRVEFSRPAKAARHLWVAGISPSITKEKLEEEFLKFGKIEKYTFFRDRNAAFIDFYKLEDAISAHKSMNGKRLAGEPLCVDFQRSQPMRMESEYDPRNGHFNRRALEPHERPTAPDGMRGFHDTLHHGSKRHMPLGARREGQPSNVLWVGYPLSVQMDEQMLHNAMILFGEIERIKCFPSRHYAFVEFRSIDEARRAKEGLQGRLFNDPRIQILFSSSEVAAHQDNPLPFRGLTGPRPDIFYSEGPLGPLELLGSAGPVAANSFSGPLVSNSLQGPNALMRQFVAQGFDPRHGGPEYHDFDGMPSTWRHRSPSAPGILPSPPGLPPPFQSTSAGWDGFDTRETKRSRMDAYRPDDAPYDARRMDNGGFGDLSRFPHPDRAASVQRHFSPAIPGHSDLHRSPDVDHSWRGIIAKGGTYVCHARCVPIGRGIDCPLSDVVNCSARTGLDMLTRHYADASGFDVIFFLPDSEEDFASYTEFLRYLGSKSRAGVAKLDDGTTLFLVPPSDFLTKVLNVNGPDRLYGVVLHLPQRPTSPAVQQPPLAITSMQSYPGDREYMSTSHRSYDPAQKKDVKVDYGNSLHEVPLNHAGIGGPLSTYADETRAESAPVDHPRTRTVLPQVEVSLTPELIATLASLVPGNNQSSSAVGTVPMLANSIATSVSSAASMTHDGSVPFQHWRQEHQAAVSRTAMEQPSNLSLLLAQQFNNQASNISHLPTYGNIPGGQDCLVQPNISGEVIQTSAVSMPQPLTLSMRPMNTPHVVQSQDGQFAASQIAMALPHPQNAMTLPPEKVSMDFSSQGQPGQQGQQLQTILSGSSEGTSGSELDKNQRYQSTLQLAASLLQQIQQQQRQGSAQAAPGTGNRQ